MNSSNAQERHGGGTNGSGNGSGKRSLSLAFLSSPPQGAPRSLRKTGAMPLHPAFVLHDRIVAFHGLSASNRAQWRDCLQLLGATVWDTPALTPRAVQRADPSFSAAGTVLVVTDYWVDRLPSPSTRPPTAGKLEYVFVTEFWLHEVLQRNAWIPLAASVFFVPPPVAQCGTTPEDDATSRHGVQHLISYPMNYVMETDATFTATDMDGNSPTPVLLPCSPAYKWNDAVPLWPYLVAFLQMPMTNAQELATVIRRTTGDLDRHYNCLEVAIDTQLSPEDRDVFFKQALPAMRSLVLALPFQFPTPPHLLTPIALPSSRFAVHDTGNVSSLRVTERSLHLTRIQTLTLLATSFLSMFPGQDQACGKDMVEFPNPNMARMFAVPDMHMRSRGRPNFVNHKVHKVRTVLEYFLRIVARMESAPTTLDDEIVSFTRISAIDCIPGMLPPTPNATASEYARMVIQHLRSTAPGGSPKLELSSPASVDERERGQRQHQAETSDVEDVLKNNDMSLRLCAVRVTSTALIEDLHDHVQLDFANKYPGGGVMNSGCVQEEIRFLLSPELLLSCLVFARLERGEAFAVQGSERFSAYTGYGNTYEFAGSFSDPTPLVDVATIDPQSGGTARRRTNVVVGMDAISYDGPPHRRGLQYLREGVLRDLCKACVAFSYREPPSNSWPLATGNWGCGVFQGDPELKFLIQWIAASLVGRQAMVYVLVDKNSELERKIRALLQITLSVGGANDDLVHQRVGEWLVEFLMSMKEGFRPVEPTSSAATSSVATRGQRRAPRRASGAPPRGSAHPDSVLDQAGAFLQAKIATLATTLTREEEGKEKEVISIASSESPDSSSSLSISTSTPSSPPANTSKTQTQLTSFFPRCHDQENEGLPG